MTVYEQQLTTFWTVDTPLNEQYEYEPEIVIEARDLPQDPMQRRMMMIMTFVLLGALLFAVLVMPRLAKADLPFITESNRTEPIIPLTNNDNIAADVVNKPVNYQGKISAVFF